MEDAVNTTPVRPLPPADYPNAFRVMLMARNDLIGFWPQSAYESDFFGRNFINRYIYIANSPEMVEEVFIKKHDNYQRKSAFMRKALEPLLGDGLFISDGATWKKRRAMEAPAFTPARLKQFTEIMCVCASECAEKWETHSDGQETPVLAEMAALTAEILSRCMFGNQLGHENAGAIVNGFSQYQASIEKFDLSSFFGLPDWLPKLPQRSRVLKMAHNIHRIVDNIIQQHLATPQSSDSLLSMLLAGYNPDSPDSITLEQVRNEAVVILMAGHETTANTLAWAWYLLSISPHATAKLHKELDTVLEQRLPTFDNIPDLVYTRAIIEETLRLYPPVPILSREALADDEIAGHPVPKGSVLLIIPWLLHRRAAYWEKPHEFIPERFTRDWPTRHHKYSYIPFSVGPRNCLGAAFGLTEAILCLATLAQKFSLSIKEGRKIDYECRLTLRPKDSLPMIISKR